MSFLRPQKPQANGNSIRKSSEMGNYVLREKDAREKDRAGNYQRRINHTVEPVSASEKSASGRRAGMCRHEKRTGYPLQQKTHRRRSCGISTKNANRRHGFTPVVWLRQFAAFFSIPLRSLRLMVGPSSSFLPAAKCCKEGRR